MMTFLRSIAGLARAGGLTALVLAAAAAAPAHAGPAVTVYTHDLGFVREQRALNLSRDRDTLMVPVPERIDFTSVRLVPQGARLVRLAYRFDVPSGDGALDHARGNRVRVVLRGDRVVEGTLVAVDGSWLVVREDDGSVHTLSRAAADDVRIASASNRLTLQPALEAVLEGHRGRLNAELSYLTGGLSWTAEHVVVRRGETGASWASRVTVENTTGREFADATLRLVAGDPNRDSAMPPPMPMMRAQSMVAGDVAQKSEMTEQTFGEYHLYTIDHPATLRDRETQTLTMYDPRDIRLTPRYLYRGGDAAGVHAQLVIVNDRASGLGLPLPEGRVRFYEEDPSGALQFTGETHIKHTAQDEKLTLDVGIAFDLVAERRETSNKRISDREREYGVEIKLRNRKKTNVTIVVEESAGGDIEITQKSHEFVRKDANTLQFTVAVPAGKEVIVTYTARQRW
jgi:hypothetical protein